MEQAQIFILRAKKPLFCLLPGGFYLSIIITFVSTKTKRTDMRKFLAVAIAALLCCTAVLGQKGKHKPSFGFKAGGNLSTFRQVVSYPDYDARLKLGMVVGAFVD